MRVNINDKWFDLHALATASRSDLGLTESVGLQLLRSWFDGQQDFTFHTSGSTGAPRPITFSRTQLEASAKLSIDALGLKPGMKSLACLDPRFVAGGMMIIRSAVAGMDVVIRRPSSNPLIDLREKVDFAALVPLQLSAALLDCPDKIALISVVIVGGAAIPESMIPSLDSYSGRFFATYGMTETLTHIALRKLNNPGKQNSFYLLPGISASSDERNCLVINAPHLGPMPIVTNDLVDWNNDGSFRVLGRYDDVINSGGVKIQPGRVELVVDQVHRQLGLSCRYFVSAMPDARLHETVVLVMEGSPLPAAVEDEMKKLLNSQLDKFESPRQILYAAHFEETDSLKIDKSATMKRLKKTT